MNVVITLPKNLIAKLMNGEKRYEMRKHMPTLLLGRQGAFVIEKGTDKVRCFLRIDDYLEIFPWEATAWADELGVSKQYIINYCRNARRIYLWKIGGVTALHNWNRSKLGIERNPQSYVYTFRDLV